ncbi:MAG: GntR family transcriptional regulator [Rubrobacteraceae bacterium]|nr:GntR family transcriptional regulator [Rubrobacteraceae bacterium]
MRAVAVWIDVDPRSGVPIYVQIVDQVRHAIEVGGFGPGERLPTVRRLAGDLAIAPNTIVKAYSELQRAGLLESRPGVGTVVAEGVGEVARERQVAEIFRRLRVIARDAAALGISEDDLWASLDSEYERIPRDEGGEEQL